MSILPRARKQTPQRPLTYKTVAAVLSAAALLGTAIGGLWTWRDKKDEAAAEVATDIPCVTTHERGAALLKLHHPKASDTAAVMQQLELSGAEVAAHMRQLPNIFVCRSLRTDSLGYFSTARGIIGIRAGAGMNVVAHEYFHAHQQAMTAKTAGDVYLTTRDLAFADMLGEATAAAYELVLEKEAQIMGVEYKANGNTTSQSYTLRRVFNNAYQDFRDYAPSQTEENINRALEYAGRRVVISLMKGEDREWANSYTDLAISNTKKAKVAVQGCDAAYRRARDSYFKAQGYVTREFNLVPVVYTGDGADTYIKRDFSVHMTLSSKTAMNNGCASPPPPPAA